jgi:hypothetical protein
MLMLMMTMLLQLLMMMLMMMIMMMVIIIMHKTVRKLYGWRKLLCSWWLRWLWYHDNVHDIDDDDDDVYDVEYADDSNNYDVDVQFSMG